MASETLIAWNRLGHKLSFGGDFYCVAVATLAFDTTLLVHTWYSCSQQPHRERFWKTRTSRFVPASNPECWAAWDDSGWKVFQCVFFMCCNNFLWWHTTLWAGGWISVRLNYSNSFLICLWKGYHFQLLPQLHKTHREVSAIDNCGDWSSSSLTLIKPWFNNNAVYITGDFHLLHFNSRNGLFMTCPCF